MKTLLACALALVVTAAAAQPTESVGITAKAEFDGPDGLRLSCFALACFDDGNAHGGSILETSQSGNSLRVDLNRIEFKLRLRDWTPNAVEFLKSTVDRCVAERQSAKGLFAAMVEPDNTGCFISPPRAKALIDNVYTAVSSAKAADDLQREQSAAFEQARQREKQEREDSVRRRMKQDEDRGYKHMSLMDYELDSQEMRSGTKIAISGFYQSLGQLELLVESPRQEAPKVVILTASSPREVRKKLIECRGGFCRLTVLGSTTICNVTWLGNPVAKRTCLAIEDMWGIQQSQ